MSDNKNADISKGSIYFYRWNGEPLKFRYLVDLQDYPKNVVFYFHQLKHKNSMIYSFGNNWQAEDVFHEDVIQFTFIDYQNDTI